MVRTINEAAYEARRNAILDAAWHAIETQGYEQMAIADILGKLHISSGAFYHYFDSKPALLLALVERMGNEVEQLVLPIIHDPTLSSLDKLQRFFAVLDYRKREQKRFVLAYLRVWYGDENAIVRHKLYTIRVKRFTPWLEEIIQEGTREGVFQTLYPDQAARMIISLLEDLGSATVELILSEERSPTIYPASNESLPQLSMLWNASWERQQVVCLVLPTKNSLSGSPRLLHRRFRLLHRL